MIVVQLTGLYRGCLCIKEPYYLYLKKDKGLQVNDTKNIQDGSTVYSKIDRKKRSPIWATEI